MGLESMDLTRSCQLALANHAKFLDFNTSTKQEQGFSMGAPHGTGSLCQILAYSSSLFF